MAIFDGECEYFRSMEHDDKKLLIFLLSETLDRIDNYVDMLRTLEYENRTRRYKHKTQYLNVSLEEKIGQTIFQRLLQITEDIDELRECGNFRIKRLIDDCCGCVKGWKNRRFEVD